MATIAMRRIREGEVPPDGGTAVQEDPECGNVLAVSMQPVQMTKKVRVRCGRCSTVNVSVIDGYEAPSGGPERKE